MKKGFAFILALVIGLSFSGCELETGENFHFVSLEITDADVPDNFVLNGVHNIEVTFTRPDECTFFQGFDVFPDENGVRTIVAIGSVLTDEESCALTQDSMTGTLTITAIIEESYTLRFYAGVDAEGNQLYLEFFVPVIEEN